MNHPTAGPVAFPMEMIVKNLSTCLLEILGIPRSAEIDWTTLRVLETFKSYVRSVRQRYGSGHNPFFAWETEYNFEISPRMSSWFGLDWVDLSHTLLQLWTSQLENMEITCNDLSSLIRSTEAFFVQAIEASKPIPELPRCHKIYGILVRMAQIETIYRLCADTFTYQENPEQVNTDNWYVCSYGPRITFYVHRDCPMYSFEDREDLCRYFLQRKWFLEKYVLWKEQRQPPLLSIKEETWDEDVLWGHL